MNKRMTKAVALSTALLIGSSFITVNAANIKKQVTAAYYNIKVTLDGQYKTPTNEPFMIGDSVYVGLRDFAEITGNQVQWDGANKTVKIASNGSANDSEIMQKNLKIAELEAKVRQLEEKIKQLEGTGSKPDTSKPDTSSPISATTLKKVLADLTKEYDDKHSVDWEFDLAFNSKSKQLEFEVSYDSYYDKKDFDRMSDNKIQSFLKDMCDDIQEALGEYAVVGEIVDSEEDESVYAFEMSTTGKLKVRPVNSSKSLDDYQDLMITKYTELPKLDQEGISGFAIKVDDISVDEDDDFEEITFEIYTDFDSKNTTYKTAWNSLTTSKTRPLKSWVEEIAKVTKDKFGAKEVFGYIYDAQDNIIASYEYDRFSVSEIK